MALFFSALALAVIVGLYIYQREAEGILAARKLSKYPRLSAALFRIDDLAGAICGAPAVFSVLGGVCVLGLRLFIWLVSANWIPITLGTLWGWPTSPQEIATGLLGLDQIVWWFMSAPLELWLIVIFPSIWFASLTLPTTLAKRVFGRRPVVARAESKDRIT
jgi:hypothetical protein